MRIEEGFELRNICGETIVVGHGKANIDFSKIISLNESAAYLWTKVENRDFDAQELARLLTEEYDVDEATALRDATKMLQDWVDAGLAQ